MKKCTVCEHDVLDFNAKILTGLTTEYVICDNCYSSNRRKIASYRYKPTANFKGKHTRYFGVEVELVPAFRNNNGRMLAAGLILKNFKDLVYLKEDGSVSSYGFEVVTHPFSFGQMYHKRYFSKFEGMPIKSFSDETCGLHVHVSRTGLTNLTLAKLVYFFANPENENFLKYIGQRDWNEFCNNHKKGQNKRDLAGLDRYKAINFCNDHTVEFRFFKGNTKPAAIYRAVEFCNAILDFCAQTSAHKLTWKEFKNWMNGTDVSFYYKTRHLKTFVNKYRHTDDS